MKRKKMHSIPLSAFVLVVALGAKRPLEADGNRALINGMSRRVGHNWLSARLRTRSAQRPPCPPLPFAPWKIAPTARVLTMSPSPWAIRKFVRNRVDNELIRTTVAIAMATAHRSLPSRFTRS